MSMLMQAMGFMVGLVVVVTLLLLLLLLAL